MNNVHIFLIVPVFTNWRRHTARGHRDRLNLWDAGSVGRVEECAHTPPLSRGRRGLDQASPITR